MAPHKRSRAPAPTLQPSAPENALLSAPPLAVPLAHYMIGSAVVVAFLAILVYLRVFNVQKLYKRCTRGASDCCSSAFFSCRRQVNVARRWWREQQSKRAHGEPPAFTETSDAAVAAAPGSARAANARSAKLRNRNDRKVREIGRAHV